MGKKYEIYTMNLNFLKDKIENLNLVIKKVWTYPEVHLKITRNKFDLQLDNFSTKKYFLSQLTNKIFSKKKLIFLRKQKLSCDIFLLDSSLDGTKIGAPWPTFKIYPTQNRV